MVKALLLRNVHLAELIRGASSAFMLRLLGAGAAFLLNVVLARLLGSDGIGIYFLSLVVVTFASTVGRYGTDNLVLREVAKHAADKDWTSVKASHRQCLKIIVLVSVPISIAVALFADEISTQVFDKPELSAPLRIMAASILPLSLLNLYANSLKGLKKVKFAVTVQNNLLPIFTICGLYFFISEQDAFGAASIYTVATLLACVAGLMLWIQSVSHYPSERHTVHLHKDLHTSARHFLVISIIAFSMKWMSTIMLGIWGTAGDVGVFNIAQRTALLTSFILVAVNTISAPKFAELYQLKDMQGLKKTAVYSARLMALFALPLLGLYLIVPQWVLSLFGDEFSEGGVILSILAVGQFINVATGSVAYILMMTGLESLMMKNMVFSLVLGLTLNLLLVPSLGSVGAAIATAITMSVQNLLAAAIVYKKLGIVTLPINCFLRSDNHS